MCGGGKGGDSQTQTSSTNSTATQSPPDYLNSAYQNLVQNAQGIASQPLQQYPVGDLQAPFNSTQTQAFNQVAGAQGAANPYINAASNAVGASQTPLWSGVQQFSPDNIQQYENPYQTDVINSTMAQINQLNQQQQSQLQGNAVSNHALGGDRAGIAAASLANQQGLAAGQTLAQLNNQNYAQAQGEFNNQQASQLGANEANSWLNSQAGSLYSNLGNQALNTALTGSQALLSTGNQQQAQTQQGLNLPYEEFLQQQAYPFQTSQYLANILEGIGGVGGGTTTGSSTGTQTTSQSAPSLLSQILGGVAGGAGIAGQLGLFNSAPTPTGTGSSGADYSDYAADFGNLGSLGQSQSSASNFLGPYSSTSGITYNRGGVIGRRRLAAGGIGGPVNKGGSGVPDVDVNFIPTSAPTGVHGDFPNLPTPPQPSQGGGGGGGDNTLGQIGQVASIAAMFMKRGGLIPHRASGGGVYSAMGAARRGAPKVPAQKAFDYLKTPKFDMGGGVGGLMPTAQNQAPIVQQNYAKYAQMPVEKLHEMSVRTGTSPQGGLVNNALMQKEMMPNVSSGMARGGVSHGTLRRGYEDGGDINGISIPFPPPPSNNDAFLAGTPIEMAAAEDAASQAGAVPSGGLAAPQQSAPEPVTLPTPQFSQAPVGHHEAAAAPTHYTPGAAEQADPWAALSQAGFAIMGGRHANALTNIGEGALVGEKAYEKMKNDASDRTYKTGQIADAVNRLNQEADFHRDTVNHEQEQLDQSAIKENNESAYRQADLGIRGKTAQQGKWTLVPDPMGGGFVRMNNVTGEVVPVSSGASTDGKRSLANVYTPPLDDKGLPLKGDDYYATVPPQIASQAKLIQNADKAPPTGMSTRNPALMAAETAAKNADPTYRGTRFNTVKQFTDPNSKTATTVRSQNVAMEHLGTLHEAVDALNNGDIPLFNRLSQEVAIQTGQPAPTNFDFGKNLVFDEVAKAVLPGGGALADRQEFSKHMTDASSREQAVGQLNEAEKYMAGQAYGLQKSYEVGTGWEGKDAPTDKVFRNRFLDGRAKSLMDKYYPEDGAAPAKQPAQQPLNTGSVPAMDQRTIGQTYNTPKGPLIWQGNGWSKP